MGRRDRAGPRPGLLTSSALEPLGSGMASRDAPAAVLTPPPDADDRRAGFEREALVHLDAVYRAALRLAGNGADADDLVQTAMLNAYRGWHRFQPGTNARAWLLTIVRNVFINEYRRTSARRETADVNMIERAAALGDREHVDPEAAFFDAHVDDEVQRAVASLSLELREIVGLVDVEGLRYEEAARVLGVPVGTVKSRLFRARRLLQARLHAYAERTGWMRGRGAAQAAR